MKLLLGRVPLRGEKGFTLLEALIAIAVMGIVAAGILSALAGASRALFFANERETAMNLAEHQIEFIQSQAFDLSGYQTDIPSNYSAAGYTVAPLVSPSTVQSVGDGIQLIDIKVSHNGRLIVMSADSTTLQGYKVQ